MKKIPEGAVSVIDSVTNRRTIQNEVVLDGLSPHDFKDCQAVLKPAKPNEGIIFETPRGEIKATPENLNRDEKRHTTSLKSGLANVRTVEHLLSAIKGCGVDDIRISIQRCGIPFRDFSAEWFTQKIKQAGLMEQPAKLRTIKINKQFTLESDGRKIIFDVPLVANNLTIESTIEYPNPIGKQSALFNFNPDDYHKSVCWARSVVASPLDDDGNVWERIRQIFPILPEDPTESPLICHNQEGYLTPLRHENEPAVHKLIDFIGDLALLDCKIEGTLIIHKSGHAFNHENIDQLNDHLGWKVDK